MRYALAVALGKLVRVAARLRKPGAGSAFPGLVVNRLAPRYLTNTLEGFEHGLVVVTGSSGKSTTTKMLVSILREHGLRVFTNPSTANIAQGLTSALLEAADWRGKVVADVAVLEMDEAHAAALAERLHPRVVALTNVMIDQIDRFYDSDLVATYLRQIAARASDAVILNGDDQYLVDLGKQLDVSTVNFGVSARVYRAAERGLGYAKASKYRPREGVLVRTTDAQTATLSVHGDLLDVALPAAGTHYAVDAAAAVATAHQVLGKRWRAVRAKRAFAHLEPVFARGEFLEVQGQKLNFVLIQNPASYQLNIDQLADSDCVFFALGSDVRDPSYFWPVDPSVMQRVEIVSGLKSAEAALMLSYRGIAFTDIEPDIPTAVDAFLALPTPASGTKTFVFSADAMRRVRRHLGLTGQSS